MKASEIIIAQIKHINSNFKDYLLIALPLIIGHTLVLQAVSIIDNYTESIFFLIIIILLSIYVFYYYFRFAINLHRFVILEDRSNYFNPIKNIKNTLFYFLYFLILFILIILLIILIQVVDVLLVANYAIFTWLYIYLMIFFVIIYSVYGFILPEISIGDKVSLKASRQKTKGFRKNLCYQFLILYVPFWIFDRIISRIFADSDNIFFNFIYAIILVYLTGLFIGSLSRTYLIYKQKN